jgi:DNA-binding MarR family transcriptional regulator
MAAQDGRRDEDAPGSTAELAAQVRILAGRLWRRMRQDTATIRPDLTPVRIGVLSLIDRHAPIMIGELASLEHMHASTMTRIVDALELRGLAVRNPDDHDRRAVVVSLTAEGKAAVEQARLVEDVLLSRTLERFTESERAVLIRALPLLRRLVEG